MFYIIANSNNTYEINLTIGDYDLTELINEIQAKIRTATNNYNFVVSFNGITSKFTISSNINFSIYFDNNIRCARLFGFVNDLLEITNADSTNYTISSVTFCNFSLINSIFLYVSFLPSKIHTGKSNNLCNFVIPLNGNNNNYIDILQPKINVSLKNDVIIENIQIKINDQYIII